MVVFLKKNPPPPPATQATKLDASWPHYKGIWPLLIQPSDLSHSLIECCIIPSFFLVGFYCCYRYVIHVDSSTHAHYVLTKWSHIHQLVHYVKEPSSERLSDNISNFTDPCQYFTTYQIMHYQFTSQLKQNDNTTWIPVLNFDLWLNVYCKAPQQEWRNCW